MSGRTRAMSLRVGLSGCTDLLLFLTELAQLSLLLGLLSLCARVYVCFRMHVRAHICDVCRHMRACGMQFYTFIYWYPNSRQLYVC